MKHYMVFDGVSSADYGIYVASVEGLNAPKRSLEEVTVPGRNGSLTYDNGSYDDISLSYVFYTKKHVTENVRDFRNFILSAAGKKRLEDTLHPEEYRMGRPEEGLEMDTSDRKGGSFTMSFKCSPQRFLKTGEHKKTFTASGTIYNPTQMEAKPLIRVYGSGELTVGDRLVTIADHSYDYIDIDCMICDCYFGSTNANGSVTISTDYPVLEPGKNGITLGTGITKVEITPRWWQL